MQSWVKGIVPKNLNYSEDNMFNIYMSLAVLILKSDKRSIDEKKTFLSLHLLEKFNVDMDEIQITFSWSTSNEKIQLKSVCDWLNKKVPDIGYQSQLIYFLAGIAIIDGSINKRERKVLDDLARGLTVPMQEVDAIIASYYEAHRRKERANKRKSYRNQPRPTATKKRQMAKILEVSENASFIEIKKSYRTLVKLHHPDRFQNNGPEQILLAKERFIEIQLAYEYFENLKP